MARYPAAVLDAFARFADRVAFVHHGRETTYGDVLCQVYRLTHALHACGVGTGAGVAFLTSNSPHAFLARVAAQLLGCRAIGIDPIYSTPEQEHILADAQAVALVVDPTTYGATTGDLLRRRDPPAVLSLGPTAAGPDLLDLAEHHPDTPVAPSARHDDVARLVYTGGSTGRSKGCCHTFGALSTHWAWQPARWSPQVTSFANAAQRYLLISSIGASVGGDYMALALLRGGTVYLHDGIDAGAILQTLEQERITAQALREGWLCTGDLGFQDTDGYLYLVDRAKDMVIVRGENCFSRNIEEILARHPAVHQVAVVGIPDESTGEAVHAVVVTHPGATVPPADLQNLVLSQLSPLHVPRSVAFVEQIPLTSAGKVDKKALRAPFWDGHERQIG